MGRLTEPGRQGDVDQPDPRGLLLNAEGAITGNVVCAAVLAYTASHVEATWQVCAAIVGTLVVYWLAHLHATTLATSLLYGHHPVIALRHALSETWPILGAAAPPVLVLVLGDLVGASLRSASWAALVTTITVLTGYSYLAGARGGLGLGGRIGSAAVGAALGIVVAGLKVALH
jgi:hypothetical protein